MTQTLKAFVRANKVTAKADYADSNPNMENSANMNNFRVTLVCRASGARRQMSLFFSQGYGIQGEPTAESVLECLASDASSIDNARSFEDFANEMGYDADSRKAEKIYRTVKGQAAKLRRLLGETAYQTLLWETER